MTTAQQAIRKAAEALKGDLSTEEVIELLEGIVSTLKGKTESQPTYSPTAVAEGKSQQRDKYRKAMQKAAAQQIEQSMTAAGYIKFHGKMEDGDTQWFHKTKKTQIIHIKNNQFSVKNGEHVVQPTTDVMHIHKFLKQ